MKISNEIQFLISSSIIGTKINAIESVLTEEQMIKYKECLENEKINLQKKLEAIPLSPEQVSSILESLSV